MRVLITNDDGPSEGLEALRSALAGVASGVTTIVPHINRSGTGRAVTQAEPVLVRQIEDDPALGALYTCTGTPLDCVRVGLLSDLARSAELVISGINRGINVGDDIHYSGTFGAALEGALLERMAISISQQGTGLGWFSHGTKVTYRAAAAIAARLVRAAGAHPLPPLAVLNVNVPNVPAEPAIEPARCGRRFQRELTAPVGTPRDGGAAPYRVWAAAGGEPGIELEADTDFAVLERGAASASLVGSGAASGSSPYAVTNAWLDGAGLLAVRGDSAGTPGA